MVEIVLENGLDKKLAAVSLSTNTVRVRISDLTTDIKDQVVQDIKSAALSFFSMQLDESIDVASCSKLLVFTKYVHSDSIKEEFLFCSPLETSTNASDILKKVSPFFVTEFFYWDKVCG
ncbi:protein FAM200C-like [Procambarus clarkii]|uniref:protein FAM200C-like n=1 Tax=Procambarus clarkii TaxID=6728 RepID=UPI0037439E28